MYVIWPLGRGGGLCRDIGMRNCFYTENLKDIVFIWSDFCFYYFYYVFFLKILYFYDKLSRNFLTDFFPIPFRVNKGTALNFELRNFRGWLWYLFMGDYYTK